MTFTRDFTNYFGRAESWLGTHPVSSTGMHQESRPPLQRGLDPALTKHRHNSDIRPLRVTLKCKRGRAIFQFQTHLSPKAPCFTHSQSLLLQGVSHGLSLHHSASSPHPSFRIFLLWLYLPVCSLSPAAAGLAHQRQLRKGTGGWR